MEFVIPVAAGLLLLYMWHSNRPHVVRRAWSEDKPLDVRVVRVIAHYAVPDVDRIGSELCGVHLEQLLPVLNSLVDQGRVFKKTRWHDSRTSTVFYSLHA